jgi:aminopeptidase N
LFCEAAGGKTPNVNGVPDRQAVDILTRHVTHDSEIMPTDLFSTTMRKKIVETRSFSLLRREKTVPIHFFSFLIHSIAINMRFPASTLTTALLCMSRSAAFVVAKRGASSVCRRSSLLPSFLQLPRMMTVCHLSSSTTSTSSSSGTEVSKPIEVFRKDYQPLPYKVDTIELDIQLEPRKTTITTQMTIISSSPTVTLDGDRSVIELQHVLLNGTLLQEGTDYQVTASELTLLQVPLHTPFQLETVVHTIPEDNTELSGLYQDSSGMYCTQMEAMGFRRFTYMADRPDQMATFSKVRIEADKEQYPVLLSNGNLLEQGSCNDNNNRHYAIWQDPFPKPTYLFAMVAGNLGKIQDEYTTKSGRRVDLQIFAEPHQTHLLHYAMLSLKRAMQWDEDRYGLEYDLDLYNIVAVDSFNMGAMENKGLNVFNTAYVLADPATATDTDFERVESVIGHEYFHNWTGNRVTCRDWFQLTLKEGLTVFRDQEFSADMNSAAVNRIENVRALRGRQFAEDAGPMAHPIRPESYISMDNFYTATVYSKGAEVIRMYQTILGVEGFNQGLKLYLERHDGQAVTCDDFLQAMADANPDIDLTLFRRWYSTPGTPVVKYRGEWNEDGTYQLQLEQETSDGKPLHIPVAVGLLDQATGNEVVSTQVLNLKESQQTFTFSDLAGPVVPSILRTFSAPVKLVSLEKDNESLALAFLAAHDTDGFNRWEAVQRLYTSLIFQHLPSKEESLSTWNYVEQAFARTLDTCLDNSDYSVSAYVLTLPSESTLAEEMDVIDPIGLHQARSTVKQQLARRFQSVLMEKYSALTELLSQTKELKFDATSIGLRRLRNVLLDYLCSLTDTPEERDRAAQLAMNHYQAATGMTDQMAGLSSLVSIDTPHRQDALDQFYQQAVGNSLVLNKWFTVQALANSPNSLETIQKLYQHPDFTLKNPNRVRALVGAFTMNAVAFHQPAGYQFLGDVLLAVDALNPQLSSRLASPLIQWRKYVTGKLMKEQLERLLAQPKLSDDLYEIVSRGLKE